MGNPRPSMALVLDIDERLDNKEFRLEVNRCFSYVGTTVVRTHEPSDEELEEGPRNQARMLVKIGSRRYLDSEDEGADELWNDVMKRWFYNQFYKIGNNIKLFNRRQREIGNPDFDFEWFHVVMKNPDMDVAIHLDSNSSFEAEASALLTAFRNAYNQGLLGEGVIGAFMPARNDYILQEEEGLEAKASREAQREDEELREQQLLEEEAEKESQEAEELFLESPALADQPVSEEEAQAILDEEALQAELERKYSFPEKDFDIDYHLWEVLYDDKESEIFDMTEVMDDLGIARVER